MPVDPAISLFQPGRRKGDLDVDHPVAVLLEVDAFTRRVRRKEDAHGRAGRVGLEDRLRVLSLLGVHAAVKQRDAVSGEPGGRQQVQQPVLRVPVLGEDDDPLVVPLSAGTAPLFELREQHLRLGVRSPGLAHGPFPHFRQQPVLVRREGLHRSRRGGQCVLSCFGEILLVADLLVETLERRTEKGIVRLERSLTPPEGHQVLADRVQERRRR